MAEEIEEIEEVNYYKLGPKASNFYDPTQPKNKKVLPNQVVELEHTSAVDTAVTNKHIVVATKKDQKAYKDRLSKEAETAADALTTSVQSESDKAVEDAKKEAAKLTQDAKDEAKQLLADAKKEAAAITADAKKAAANPAPAK